VPLIKVFTGMTAAQFEAMSSGAKGLVVEGTGAGKERRRNKNIEDKK
jgi:L-asparaginase/Glu-tRNA(Gln) amidotransferase subunit D